MIWWGLAGWLVIVCVGALYAYRNEKWKRDMTFHRHVTNRCVGELQSSLTQVEGAIGMRDGELVKRITEGLDAELEKSAELTEMRRARRRHLPRENAGPPAKVSRLRLNRK